MSARARPRPQDGAYYEFVRNSRSVHSTVVHFQLRNLLAATSANDVFVVHDNCVNHFSPATRRITQARRHGLSALCHLAWDARGTLLAI